MRISWTETAEQDLTEIWDYIAVQSGNVRGANGVIDVIIKLVTLIADHPGIGRLREDLVSGLQSITTGNHVLFYKQIETTLFIVRALTADAIRAG